MKNSFSLRCVTVTACTIHSLMPISRSSISCSSRVPGVSGQTWASMYSPARAFSTSASTVVEVDRSRVS